MTNTLFESITNCRLFFVFEIITNEATALKIIYYTIGFGNKKKTNLMEK